MTASRYPRAIFRGPVVNTGGTLEAAAVRFFVVHVMQGSSLSGCDAWFHEARAQVSAHFGIGRDGTIYQWVDLNRVAWAEMAFNDRAISIEHAGYSGQKLTGVQLRRSLELLTWLHAQFPHVPLRRTANPNGTGVIGHGELGVVGGDHPDCPGVPILTQFGAALRPKLITKTSHPLLDALKGH